MCRDMDTPAPPQRTWQVGDAKAVGVSIRDVRFRLGMTQGELVEAVGVYRQYISELERGKETEHVVRLLQVHKVLGVKVMLSRVEEP
jgi:DNA-binding XRE family transcriptional regulator